MMREQNSLQQTGARLPFSLIVVVTLFFMHGTIAVVEMVVARSMDRDSINLGAVSLIIAVGLLLGSSWARLMAILMTCLVAVVVLVFAAMTINGVPATLEWFGSPVTEVPRWGVLTGCSVIVLISGWQLEYLMRPGTAKLFSRQPAASEGTTLRLRSVGRHD